MMREILFRGKRTDNGEWVYGSYLHLNIEEDYICDGTIWIGTKQPCKNKIDSNTLGQYTGLTDKNGTKIFEGDIIEGICHSTWSHRTQRCIVAWDETRAKFECRHYIGEPLNSDYYTYAVKFSKNVEVIGNIYDNPELLEVIK